MSRDWTPKELILAEAEIEKKDGTRIRDIHFRIDGMQEKEWKEEEKRNEAAKKYPNLSFLWQNHLLQILEKHEGNTRLQDIEDTVRELADADRKDGPDVTVKPELDFVKLWYEGKLRPGYYMDENDDAFCERVEKYVAHNQDSENEV